MLDFFLWCRKNGKIEGFVEISLDSFKVSEYTRKHWSEINPFEWGLDSYEREELEKRRKTEQPFWSTSMCLRIDDNDGICRSVCRICSWNGYLRIWGRRSWDERGRLRKSGKRCGWRREFTVSKYQVPSQCSKRRDRLGYGEEIWSFLPMIRLGYYNDLDPNFVENMKRRTGGRLKDRWYLSIPRHWCGYCWGQRQILFRPR